MKMKFIKIEIEFHFASIISLIIILNSIDNIVHLYN